MRELDFCLGENKGSNQLRSNCKADHLFFFFATRIVQFLFFLNLKFQASNHLLWLHRPVCVGPGWKPGRSVQNILVDIPASKLVNKKKIGQPAIQKKYASQYALIYKVVEKDMGLHLLEHVHLLEPI